MYENEIYSGTGANTTGQFSGGDHYDTYQTDLGQTAGRNKKEEKENKGGFFHKVLLSVSLGLFFGIFAGLGFYAVQQGTGMLEANGGASTASAVENDVDMTEAVREALQEELRGMSLSSIGNITVVDSNVSAVVEEVMPAMVSIVGNYTEEYPSFWGQTYTREVPGSGSGIIVSQNDSELLIVTNNHVVEDANYLEATFIDGSTAEAVIKGTDADMDLAVIAVSLSDLDEETRQAISIATLGDSDSLKLGEPVIAIGNALGYGQSVTNGIVSALDREIMLEDGSTGIFIQTNAAINPGNSGGALLNINGEVIGINSNKIGGSTIEGMGYAIPITSASPIIADLMERQTRSKVAEADVGYMGITPQEVTSQLAQMFNMPEGIYIAEMLKEGAADKAGLQVGDIITRFGGEKIRSYNDLQETLQYYAAGDEVTVTVMRPENGTYVSYEFKMTLGRRP
ncbi:MAG: trypsin-like peptidase domain-containing protein [Acetatifactor sp.]|nr:trypsin-like peptidase domain-containing protein [Acetatifactor sp.]